MEQAITTLLALWREEQREVNARFAAARHETTLEDRVAAGVALANLTVTEWEAAAGGRTRAWMTPRSDDLSRFDLTRGTPVLLWAEHLDGDKHQRGTISRIDRERLAITLDEDPAEWLETPGFHLEERAPQTTFQRGIQALETLRDAAPGEPARTLGKILFGEVPPSFDERHPTWTPKDDDLNPSQHDAVSQTLRARDLALIHGPPGTGKTRTLVEVIRQHVARGDTVLACAASNLATDNLVERLADTEVEVVRYGHPARVTDAVQAHTLDAKLEDNEFWRLAREWMDEANTALRRTETRYERGKLSRGERWRQRRDAWKQIDEAREHIKRAERAVMEKAQVVCSTAASAGSYVMRQKNVDVVILDEATQATDPIALVALLRAERVVMAGDPHQLPPTVISEDAARKGLRTTFFERLAEQTPDAVSLLDVQYRMHADIMAFPNAQTYGGRLKAHASVAGHLLTDEDIGAALDPMRHAPLVFIDTAGKGWEEERPDDDRSTVNPGQAGLTASEVRAVAARGVALEDIAIITPYKAQVHQLRRLLADEVLAGLEIETVDGFQGREKEAIVVDVVRSNDAQTIGFLAEVRRMNVALTRAKRQLIVIGDSATIGHHPYYAAFMDAAGDYGVYLSAWSLE